MAAGPQGIPLSSPPPPPEVTEQQQSGPVSQFAQNYQPGAGQAPKELVKQKMQEVAKILTDVARVLATTDPSSMPLLKRMVEAGSMLMRGLEQNQQQNQGGAPAASQGGPPAPSGPGQDEGSTPGNG